MSDSGQPEAEESTERMDLEAVLKRPEAARLVTRTERAWAASLVIAVTGSLAVAVVLGSLTEMKWLLLAGAALLAFLFLLGTARAVWLRPLTARRGRALARELAAAGVDVDAARSAVQLSDRYHFVRVLLDAAPDQRETD